MTIVNPLASSNLVAQATLTAARPEERQNDLRVEQIVRATVVEGGLDRAMLEFKNQRLWIQTDQELQTGQKLELQVLTTHPKLSFKLLAVPLEARLGTLFPLFAKPFNWNGLLQQIQQEGPPQTKAMKQVLTQLAAFIRPTTDLSAQELAALSKSLDRLQAAEPLFSGANGSELATSLDRLLTALNLRDSNDLPFQLKDIAQQIRQKPELIRELNSSDQQKLTGLLKQIDQSQQPLAPEQARQLSAELKALVGTNPSQLSQLLLRNEAVELPLQLKNIAHQIRQQPELLREFAMSDQQKLTGLLKQIDHTQKPLQIEQAQKLSAELKTLFISNPAQLPQFIGQKIQDLQLLQNHLTAGFELSPAILSHLKDLVEQLGVATAAKPNWPVGLHQLVQQIMGTVQPLVADPEILTQGENLGLLSQLFGLNLEASLLRERTKDALNSLKLALLGDRTELGLKGEEALHRLELFQICRARLAEQNVNFIPLPLPFLEEGYLLVDEQGNQNQKQKNKDISVHLSLHLRLSSLGNLRVDMLSEPSGLLLRVACEDQQRLNFLQSLGEQLDERLQDLNIRGVSFTTGVESPARELLKKILPSAQGILDARV